MSDFTHPKMRDSEPISLNSLPRWFWAMIAGWVLFAVIGVPRQQSSFDKRPEGVELYRSGNLTCWDKVVCCNPADESTCERIPICEMD